MDSAAWKQEMYCTACNDTEYYVLYNKGLSEGYPNIKVLVETDFV